MKKKLVKFISIGLVVLLGVSLAGCAGGLKESDVSYAGPMVDNMLAAIQAKDYSAFSKDFDDAMKSAISQDQFNAMASLFETKIGDYGSKTFEGAAYKTEKNVPYTVVVYKAKYSKEAGNVMITASFSDAGGTQKVAGFFVSSPNLVKQ